MKRGTIFEHKSWLDAKNMPLLCQVTAKNHGVIYWTAYTPGSAPPKGRWYFDEDKTDKYVGNILEEPA